MCVCIRGEEREKGREGEREGEQYCGGQRSGTVYLVSEEGSLHGLGLAE